MDLGPMIDESIVRRAADPQWRVEVDRQALEVIDALKAQLAHRWQIAHETRREIDGVVCDQYAREASASGHDISAGVARKLAALIRVQPIAPS